MIYEIRLGGGKVFHIGYLTGILGGLTITKAPGFTAADGFPPCVRAGWGTGVWNVKAIDEQAIDTNFVNSGRPLRPVDVSERAPGIGFISLHEGDRSVSVDVYLSTHIRAANGLSICEDWTRIVTDAKDDPSRDVLLSMTFGTVTAEEIESFRCGKPLWTVDLGLDVRPNGRRRED